MDYNLAFSPQLPLWLIIALGAVMLLLALLFVLRGQYGGWFRLAGAATLVFALLNPSLLSSEYEARKSVIALVVDKSDSQKLDIRPEQTAKAVEAIKQQLDRLGQFETLVISAEQKLSAEKDASTVLIGALKSGLKNIAADRFGGAILLTDGQVHDVAEHLEAGGLGLTAPVHTLLTGRKDEKDRRVVITNAPRYGVVGDSFEINFKMIEHGYGASSPAQISIFIDGEHVSTEQIRAGEQGSFIGHVPHAGQNIIELYLHADGDELTDTNNRAFWTITGIRQKLRVLLVSGEPHAGERTWRNLLKSDFSVDLVHFTILRPPGKQDGTPIHQLSLITFPTRELFVEKIDEFDLIVFDRYSRRGVLPVLYFDNIANYVRNGGALLIAAGPEFAKPGSIAVTPLQSVLPAQPDGRVFNAPFKPLVSGLGNKHPVTRDLLPGLSRNEALRQDPQWSRWFRLVGVNHAEGNRVMEAKITADNGQPLLLLNRYEEGRVALFLSDHAWLWARGFEGGGPYLQLLRRIAHWLMKEPELEEERLFADVFDNHIIVKRQSLTEDPGQARITTPSGVDTNVALNEDIPGIFSAKFKPEEIGLYQITNGEHSVLVHVGHANPQEFIELISTREKLEPMAKITGGSIIRLAEDGANLPQFLPVNRGASASGNGWIGFYDNKSRVLKGISRYDLLNGFIGLAILLLIIGAVWGREGSRGASS